MVGNDRVERIESVQASEILGLAGLASRRGIYYQMSAGITCRWAAGQSPADS